MLSFQHHNLKLYETEKGVSMSCLINKFMRNLVVTGALLYSFSAAGQTYTVDVLGLYSDHASSLISDPDARFVSYMAYANKALENSNANYRYRLVHLQQHRWPNDNSLGSTQLNSLRTNASVQSLRTKYGADLVAAIVPQSGGLCGIGYVPQGNKTTLTFPSYMKDYGYSLSGHNCGGRTLTHEIGHTMGLGHSPKQGSAGGLAVWGRGWGEDGKFVTVMAYESAYGVSSGSGRIQIHSTPALSICQGRPCGKLRTLSNGADARRALNVAAPLIAAWYPTKVTNGISGVGDTNRPPIAKNDSVVTVKNRSVSVNVLDNDVDLDGDSLSVTQWTNPANGVLNHLGNGKFVYSPATGFRGLDNFSYTLSDGNANESDAVVRIKVASSRKSLKYLVYNGKMEKPIKKWRKLSKYASVRSIRRGHTGRRSLWTRYAAYSPLRADLRARVPVIASAWLRAAQTTKARLYVRYKSYGRWRSRVFASQIIPGGRWVKLQGIKAFSIKLKSPQIVVVLGSKSHYARIDDVSVIQ